MLFRSINAYGDEMPADDIIAETTRLLETYCEATDINVSIVKQ